MKITCRFFVPFLLKKSFLVINYIFIRYWGGDDHTADLYVDGLIEHNDTISEILINQFSSKENLTPFINFLKLPQQSLKGSKDKRHLLLGKNIYIYGSISSFTSMQY